MMRICALTASYWPFEAGAEVFCRCVAEHMVKRGHDVHVVTRIDDCAGKDRAPFLKPYNVENGVHIHRVGSLKIKFIQTMSLIAPMLLKALELDREKHFDLIHAHLFPANIVGALVKKRRGGSLLISSGGGDLADYPEMWMANWLLRPMIGSALASANLVHAKSRSLVQKVRDMGAHEVVLVPNAVNLAAFQPQDRPATRRKLGYTPEEKIILTVSRLTYKNAVDVLIRATKQVLERQPAVRLLILGDGDEEARLKELTRQLALEDRIQFLGNLAHEDTAEYYALADLFVRASRQEGFGTSFIEAMAARTAVIGSSVGGILDIIVPGENGLLVPSNDVTALATAMERVLGDDGLRERLAFAGYKTVQEKFAADWVMQRMESVCEQASGLTSAAGRRFCDI